MLVKIVIKIWTLPLKTDILVYVYLVGNSLNAYFRGKLLYVHMKCILYALYMFFPSLSVFMIIKSNYFYVPSGTCWTIRLNSSISFCLFR